MSASILITGGCRSGKSAFAVELARHWQSLAPPAETLFLATCLPGEDAEMLARVAAHRAGRPPRWRVAEEGYDLPAVLAAAAEAVVIVDCIPTWISNLLVRGDSGDAIALDIDRLLDALALSPARRTLLVSAEVGSSPVPEYPLGRLFRDLTGLANQRLAAAAARVYCMIAGVPVELRRPSLDALAADLDAALGPTP